MFLHPYARSLSPVPDDPLADLPMRRTTSARPNTRTDIQKRRPLPVPQSASATHLPLRPSAADMPVRLSSKDMPTRPPPMDLLPAAAATARVRAPSAPSAPSVMGPTHRRHFVKQESAVTLVLSGHSGADTPVYTSGSVLRGLVTLARADTVAAVVVNVRTRALLIRARH
jgi:hypothetical protein